MIPGGLGAPEILIILALPLLVLRPNKLPEVGRSVGKGMREFKNAVTDGDRDRDDDDVDELVAARTDG